MKAPASFTAGNPAGPVNVAVQRPTVNVKEAENVGEEMAAEVRRNQEAGLRFSKHGTFGPKKVTHPGFEEE